MKPTLFTFDILGTVLDWRTGLQQAVSSKGYAFRPDDFDRIIDFQGLEERKAYKPYVEIKALSIIEILGMRPEDAREIAMNCGKWPLFRDSKEGMKALMSIAPCAAISNSDFIHADQVQSTLGKLSNWVCAEETKTYKPSVKAWEYTSKKLNTPFSRNWWHVSAYADYDLEVARDLGLTCIFVNREHSRKGFAHHQVEDLKALADLVRAYFEEKQF
jgi:2-haloalkanoic acid dehalogenase type II